MTPKELAKSGTESGHQRALFCWANLAMNYGFEIANKISFEDAGQLIHKQLPAKPVPELKWLHAIPNGGSRGDDAKSRAIRGGVMKAEGVKAGIPDVFLPVAKISWNQFYPGLYIEMKKPGGKASKEQLEFKEFALSQGYGWILCDNWIDATRVIQSYLEG